MQPKTPEIDWGIDLKGNFNFLCRATSFFALWVIPFLLGGNGTRVYGAQAFFVCLTMPIIAELTHSQAMLSYWKLWCVMVVIRKITADRSQNTDYWGHSILRWLTFGRHRFFEPLAVALVAFLLGPVSVPLARVFWAGAISLAFQYRVAAEIEKRRAEARRNLAIDANRYL